MYITALRYDSTSTLDSYATQLPVTHHLKRLGRWELRSPITIIVGENGSGKSTLIEAIAMSMGVNAEGGTKKRMNFSYAGTESDLHNALVISRAHNPPNVVFLRAETFFNYASEHDRTVIMEAPLHPKSHGEAVTSFLSRNLRKPALFLFDEPEAGLSPVRQITLIADIHRAAQQGAQFIIATHSALLPAIPGAHIIEISTEAIRECTFDECLPVRDTLAFLADAEEITAEICNIPHHNAENAP